MMTLTPVIGQYDFWTGLECEIDNQKLYDNLDTCDEYCTSPVGGMYHNGRCESNNEYAECHCFFSPN